MLENLLLIKNFNIYLILSNLLFIGGLFGIILAKNTINWLVCIELLFLSSFLNFIIFSSYYLNIDGFIYSLVILILAAAESALGLSIIAVFYNDNKDINIYSKKNIKT